MPTFNLDHHRLAGAFIEGVEKADVEGLLALMEPDATSWFAYLGPEGVRMPARAAVENIAAMRAHVSEYRYVQVTRQLTARGFWQTAKVRCVSKRGTLLRFSIGLIVDVGPSGRIQEYREYIDKAQTLPFLKEIGRA